MSTVRLALVVSALLSLAGRAGAEASRPLLLPAEEGGARLQLATGERIALPVPPGSAIDTALPLETGWLAAGIRPDAEGRSEILLLTGDGAVATELPPPGGRTAPMRQQPLPLVDDGRLTGLLWLEGNDRRTFGVRFAEWTGAGWSAPRTVAAPGPGSQLALTAARLTDGSWLAAWSAFDGTDDEIVWSRRAKDGTWSPARRAAGGNEVPDITPTLTATRGGALLAWSRFDGAEYRVMVSRFHDGAWSRPEIAGGPGTLYPTFEPAPRGKAWLLYRTAEPRGWALAELDANGRTLRQAAVPTETPAAERPTLRAGTTGLRFTWPGRTGERTARWEKQP